MHKRDNPKINFYTNGYPSQDDPLRYSFSHEEIKTYKNLGYDVLVHDIMFSDTKEIINEEYNGINVKRYRLNPPKYVNKKVFYLLYLLWNFRGGKKLKNEWHLFNFFEPFYIFIICFLKTNKCGIIIHGTDAFSIYKFKYRILALILLFKVKTIQCRSEFTANLVKFAFSGKFSKKVIVNISGVNKEKIIKNKTSKKNAYKNLNFDTKLNFLFVGDLIPRKGIDTAFYVLFHYKKINSDFVYHIIGKGPEELSLRKLAEELGITDNIRFYNYYISDEKLAYFFRASDIYLMLSQNVYKPNKVEGFGLSFAEAACYGLPSFAGRSGGVANAVIEDITGYIFDTNDKKSFIEIANKMNVILSDRQKHQELCLSALNYGMKNFDWNINVKKSLHNLCE